jgi:hypothetical protein
MYCSTDHEQLESLVFSLFVTKQPLGSGPGSCLQDPKRSVSQPDARFFIGIVQFMSGFALRSPEGGY